MVNIYLQVELCIEREERFNPFVRVVRVEKKSRYGGEKVVKRYDVTEEVNSESMVRGK